MVGAVSLSIAPSDAAPDYDPVPGTRPVVGGDTVLRPRLFARLDQAVASPVVVLAAPAGYGKTTLLARWSEARDPALTAWVNGGHPTGALDPTVRWLEGPWHRSHRAAAEPAVLVIDDAHAIDAATARRLDRVIRALGPGRSIVLVGRGLGAMSMLDLGLTTRVARLAARELRFDRQEALELLGATCSDRLDPAGVDRLLTLTEGWAAGLRLAAMCLEETDGRNSATWSEPLLISLVGNYLDREVLVGTAGADLDALARLALTEQIPVDFAEAVAGRPDARRLLESMVEDHLFVESDGDGTYRYHPLMAEHLRHRLGTRNRAEAQAAHSAVAAWMVANGDEAGAVGHLLEAGERDRALAVAAASVTVHLTSGLMPGSAPALPADFPPPFLMADRIRMYPVVVSLLAQWRLSEASEWLRRFEAGMGEGEAEGADRIRAEWLWVMHDSIALYPEGVLAHWHRVSPGPESAPAGGPGPDWLPALDEAVAAAARWAAARAGAELGQPDAARILLSQNQHLEHEPQGLLALGPLAAVALAGGRLGQALSLAGRAVAASGAAAVPAMDGHLTLAIARYERDELPDARRHASAARRLALEVDSAHWAAAADVVTARLELSAGSARRALGLLDAVRVAHRSPLPPSLLDDVARTEFRARLGLGDVDGARDILDALDPVRRPPNALARLHLSAGRPDRAAAELSRGAGRRSVPREEMERLLLHARANLQLGGLPAAEHSLQRALELGRPERFIRVFLEEPPQVVEALRGLQAHRPDGYVDEILARAASRPGAGHDHSGAVAPASILEPLTDRERELVGFLPSHLTQHEIARQMYISANTVKTHMKGLYRKLGATSRSEAVELARACGLL